MYDLPDYRLEPPDPTPEEEEFNECMGAVEGCVDELARIFKYDIDYEDLDHIKALLEEALNACEDAPDYRKD